MFAKLFGVKAPLSSQIIISRTHAWHCLSFGLLSNPKMPSSAVKEWDWEWKWKWNWKWEEKTVFMKNRWQNISKKSLPLSCLVLMWFAWFCTILCFHSDDPLCNSVNKSNNRRHLKRAPESRPAAPKKRDHQAGKTYRELSRIKDFNFRTSQTPASSRHWSDCVSVSLAGQTWPPLPALSDV